MCRYWCHEKATKWQEKTCIKKFCSPKCSNSNREKERRRKKNDDNDDNDNNVDPQSQLLLFPSSIDNQAGF